MKIITGTLLLACLSTSTYASDCPQGKKTFFEWFKQNADYQKVTPNEFLLNSKACYIGHNKKGSLSNREVVVHDYMGQLQLIKDAEDKAEALEKVLVALTEKNDLFIDLRYTPSQEEDQVLIALSGWEFIEGGIYKFSVEISEGL